MEEQLFSRTDRRDAAATAALLRSLADDLESGIGFDALAGEDVDVGVPTEMDIEFEVDRVTTDDGETRDLAVELTWDPDDERAAEETESAGTDGPPTTDAADTTTGPTNAPGNATPDSQAAFEVYRDRADEWRWRLRHRNGNIVADSGEGYNRKRGAINGLESVQRNAPGADVELED
ncbi:Uncharacterized conserved protein YegP, UPF0339 family [Halorientalis persicus]|jgi:uncharacterized protein YegP (UPF0339 family)|uniref:Uncharacterized conserved protein YegP, UPF0339 family n=1 Tax=Halorientalis persicus TaxID=1367881 RepID=A0A1H8IUZ9_9EURY|nr:HVO_2922 family protein [Halorientalis persicus]SEN72261.1 Uncharacterized conserved protein YegP, UPF0339 family [Halorientalis persicus]